MIRKNTRKIKIGNIYVGGDSPVIIQGMTKVPTSNISFLLKESKKLENEGAEIIRISILNEKDTDSIKVLKKEIKVPIVADIHYNKKLALYSIEKGIDKIRINPGNMKRNDLKEIIKQAKNKNIPIRIGINSGSIKVKRSLVENVIEKTTETIKFFQDNDFNDIIISAKTPFVKETIEIYRKLAEKFNYPLHLGITEAGKGYMAESKSILGIGILLNEGIGDTIRVSLTESSVKEIKIAQSILQALGLRRFEPEIISCPTCGRIQVALFDVLKKVEKEILRLNKKYPFVKNLKIAVMGCSVNGPGEAKQADIGIAGGVGKFAFFKKGIIIGTYKKEEIINKLIKEIIKMEEKNGRKRN
ncbi:MAG TPA: flavodoxin-dependent (E)-4-hydroxy-3-methylbut-2-enyl-diphosphate synthase [Candidatus Ratteibacteria bacterium]|nr:flavodoxin-dependent (E)-4-hydroxy-3-methylbut-2-enyl-diphosphate synthase [Candidatus Ratteibacteria bacterium]